MSKLETLRASVPSVPSQALPAGVDLVKEVAQLREVLGAMPQAIARQLGPATDQLNSVSTSTQASIQGLGENIGRLKKSRENLVKRVEDALGSLPREVDTLTKAVEAEDKERGNLGAELQEVRRMLSKHVMRMEVLLWVGGLALLVGIALGSFGMREYAQREMKSGSASVTVSQSESAKQEIASLKTELDEVQGTAQWAKEMWLRATPKEREWLELILKRQAPGAQ